MNLDIPTISSNTSGSHAQLIKRCLEVGHNELFWVSPFLAADLESLLDGFEFGQVTQFTLVTTLKANDQDQINKPKSLKSFFRLAKKYFPAAKVKIHIDNRLHGKIYIFRGNESGSAIVTSANLTNNGMYHNHEWGVHFSDLGVISNLINEVLENIEYPDVTEFLVDRLVMFAEQYSKDNPEWGEYNIPQCDILESVYHQSSKQTGQIRYYLKPIGVSEDPIYKESCRDFSDLHQDLAFSKKGTGSIQAGDIVITTAVGCGCLLSYFVITGSPREASHEEKQSDPWKNRWPWHLEGRNSSVQYGGCWWEHDLERGRLLDKFLNTFPNKAVTKAGGFSLGTINFGSDKVEITKEFAEFLMSEINSVC